MNEKEIKGNGMRFCKSWCKVQGREKEEKEKNG